MACLVLALTLAVAVPVLWRGGFGAPAQSMFVAIAGSALLVATLTDASGASAAARSPVVVALIGLAAMSVASAAWAIANPATAIRTGLVLGGYAAVVVAARLVAARLGAVVIAAGIAVLAAAEALAGLGSVALHALPDAERIGRTWRPGGTFEYQPALALLQVGALPVLAGWIERPDPRLAALATAGAILAGAVLMLADSRLALALAVLILLGVALRRGRARQSSAGAVAVALLAVAGGLIAPLLLGAAVGPRAHPAGMVGLAGLLAVTLGGAIALPLVRDGWRRRSRAHLAVELCAALAIAGAIVQVCAYTPGPGRQQRAHTVRAIPSSDFLHGRAQEWQAAIETWLDRPVLGAGAGTYAVASFSHQRVARSLFAHDLPLELAAELGIVGLLLGGGLYAASGRVLWRASRTGATRLLAPFVIAFLISNLFDWTWHLSGLTAIWAAAVGALGSGARADTDEPSAPRSRGRRITGPPGRLNRAFANRMRA